MKIFISMPIHETTETFITPKSIARLEEQGTVTRNMTTHHLNADELAEQAYDADVIVCGWGTPTYTKEVTDRLPNLKIIAYTGGSMANVVTEEVLESGIIALTGNYIFAQSVAEGCLCYTLCALREIEKYQNLVRNGSWTNGTWYNRGLFGRKIGIVGFGEIARNYVEMLRPFDMEILINSGHMSEEEAAAYGARLASREEIFSECDIISLHLSLTEKTRGCINRELLEMIRPDALLVNTARGAVVDEAVMEELLVQKRFSAALDVFSQEPLPQDSKLRTLENVVILPHMGGPTIDLREYITCSFAKDFAEYKEGRPMKNQFFASSLGHMTRN